MNEVFASPFFGITLSIFAYEIGVLIARKTKLAIANPLLIAIIICIAVIELAHIPLESYNAGGDLIAVFLGPATAVIAISIYNQLSRLKKYFIPILMGTLVGSIASVGSAYFLCKLFGLDDILTKSMVVKSVSTPFALAISKNIGGIPAVSVAAVVITGILGAVCAPMLIKIFRVKNPIAAGVAIGTCSHAVGTSKAIMIGEVEGAMSGIALGLAGLLTVAITLVLKF
jgi:predicted murein hydrolase (TIGR00659 family)